MSERIPGNRSFGEAARQNKAENEKIRLTERPVEAPRREQESAPEFSDFTALVEIPKGWKTYPETDDNDAENSRPEDFSSFLETLKGRARGRLADNHSAGIERTFRALAGSNPQDPETGKYVRENFAGWKMQDFKDALESSGLATSSFKKIVDAFADNVDGLQEVPGRKFSPEVVREQLVKRLKNLVSAQPGIHGNELLEDIVIGRLPDLVEISKNPPSVMFMGRNVVEYKKAGSLETISHGNDELSIALDTFFKTFLPQISRKKEAPEE